jgi:uncharacterized protein involved in exopolysaccharide biosynthesis
MKRLVFMAVSLMTINTVFATSAPTPISHIPKTPTDKIHLRISHQMAQIQKEAKRGKLTKDQAKALKAQVEAIRKDEVADLKQNGTKTLTDAQEVQINSQLDTLSKTIPIR